MTATATRPAWDLDAETLDVAAAAARFREHGCLVVRRLQRELAPAVVADIDRAARRAIANLPQAERVTEGWSTPDGALFLPAPEGWIRDKQIMLLPVTYRDSGAFLRSALEPRALAIMAAVLGPDVELFMDGQIIYKEGDGGHPKHLHQDSAYFTHRFDGPVAMLTYGVDTGLDNGALHVVPGSHRLGRLRHVDTFSHLGLDPAEWPWERATPITGRAGDAIFFHVDTIHGSKNNRSPSPRPVFVSRYRRADDFVVVGATTVANRAAAEAAATPTRREPHGIMVSGFRER